LPNRAQRFVELPFAKMKRPSDYFARSLNYAGQVLDKNGKLG
jgi:hypothetical protein